MDSAYYAARKAELEALLQEIAADRAARIVREFPIRVARETRRLRLEREVAAAISDEYAEELSLEAPIGDEWHLVASGNNPLPLCGNVDEDSLASFTFQHAEEFRLSTLCDDVGISPLSGKGLGAYGLYLVVNSTWKASILAAMSNGLPNFDAEWWASIDHFIIRGKGGELSCLARGVTQSVVPKSIQSVRRRLGGSDAILALFDE